MSRRADASSFRLAEVQSWWFAFLVLVALIVGTPAAWAVAPDHVGSTLEGCRNNGSIVLPNGAGKFICPNTAYTSGNLGKGWNELDLVPYRLTMDAGNAAPASQTYQVAVALDALDDGAPGYDVLSEPALNAALSSASCTAPDAIGADTIMTPGLGGIDATRFRVLTITQAKNTKCVYDYYGRLAVGSHLFPGSALHANLALPTATGVTTSGIGASDVSIPVNEIEPQAISKNMSASQGGDHTWSVTKQATPANVSFGDVCSADFVPSKPVAITVQWTKVAATAGSITVVANIFATNPAARVITVAVQDKLYAGSGQTTLLNTTNLGPVDVPANTAAFLIGTDTVELAAGTAGLVIGSYVNDVATATYTDKVTGVPVPGTTTAVALAQIQAGATGGSTARVRDSESITGDGLTFSVATPLVGSFNNYTADTPTTGPVQWASGAQSDTGSVTFNKTLYLDGPRVTTGTLTDQAYLLASNGFTTPSNLLSVGVSSTAFVKLTITKSIPDFLDTGEKLEVAFKVTRAGDATFEQNVTITFNGGGSTTVSAPALTGLVPDNYTVTEGDATFFPADYPNSPSTTNTGLVPFGGAQKTVDLTVGLDENDVPYANCSGTATYQNLPATTAPAKAQVKKITDPALDSTDADYYWSFALTGPGGVNEPKSAAAGGAFVGFDANLAEGTYTITETGKTGWDLTTIATDAGGSTSLAQKTCSFTVDYPEDVGKLFSCTFTNTKRGKAGVIKTVQGNAPSGSQAFTFQLRQGATITQNGTTLESLVANSGNGGVLNFSTLLVPANTYQLCEIVMPGWLTTLGTFVPNSFTPPDGVAQNPNVDNSILCVNFTVTAGETKIFTVDNTPPPGGRALTIGFWKNWSSCSGGKQKPVLNQTLASFPIASGETTHGVFIGDLYVDTCSEAIAILNKSTLGGKKLASDPAFNLAAQLLAAKLNVQAGAGACPAAVTAINAGQALLDQVNFKGTAAPSMTTAQKQQANTLATTLDRYNNNLLCN